MRVISTLQLDRRFTRPPPRTGCSPSGLAARVELLPDEDRMLVQLAMRGQMTRRALAGVFRCQPGTITRRLRRLMLRLHDPLSIALSEPDCPLPPEHRQVGLEYFLLGLSARIIGEKHRMPYWQVRQMLDFVRGWHRALRVQR